MNQAHASVLMAIAFFAVSACSRTPSEQEPANQSRPIPSACRIHGNKQNEVICSTAMSTILAAPDQFDGMAVSFVAWAEPVNDAIVAFPSPDTMQMRDSATSVVIYPSKNPDVKRSIGSNNWNSPELVRLTGVFRWIGSDGSHSFADPIDRGRIGVMENVSVGR